MLINGNKWLKKAMNQEKKHTKEMIEDAQYDFKVLSLVVLILVSLMNT